MRLWAIHQRITDDHKIINKKYEKAGKMEQPYSRYLLQRTFHSKKNVFLWLLLPKRFYFYKITKKEFLIFLNDQLYSFSMSKDATA